MLGLGAILVLLMLGGVSALSLNVTSPEDGENYGSRSVPFDLSSDEVSDFYYLKMTDGQEGRWVQLCRDVLVCAKTKTFAEGDNNILIKIVDRDGNVNLSSERGFTIDSKKPRIMKVLPRRNSFVNNSAEFFVEFIEDNVGNITLNHSDGSFSDCTNKNFEKRNGKLTGKGNCTIVINLSEDKGFEQDYWFEIKDIVGNNVSSRPVMIKVDTSPPVKQHYDKDIDQRRVNFLFDIEELNFKEVSYVDDFEGDQTKRLCSSLRNGLCTSRKSFKPGNHTLTFTILDDAGNSQRFTDNFMIY